MDRISAVGYTEDTLKWTTVTNLEDFEATDSESDADSESIDE